MQGLYTVKEVQKVLGVSKGRAYQLVSSGEVPHVRVGKLMRVRPADLESYLQRNLVRGPQA